MDSLILQFLKTNGEGVMKIFIGVSDAKAATTRPEAEGTEAFLSLEYSQEEIDTHLEGLFKIRLTPSNSCSV